MDKLPPRIQGEACVNDLAAPFSISQPAISKHLKVLEKAGLITRGREAQWRPCRLAPAPLKDASEWLDRYRRFWEESFDRLEDYLTRPMLVVSRRFTALPERLFDAWFDPKAVGTWLFATPGGVSNHVEIDARLGGGFAVHEQRVISSRLISVSIARSSVPTGSFSPSRPTSLALPLW
jgi:hypothetical protein